MFCKLCLSDQFYAEGAYYGDFNRDGKLDEVAGPFWFEGPVFQRSILTLNPKSAMSAIQGHGSGSLHQIVSRQSWLWMGCLLFGGVWIFWEGSQINGFFRYWDLSKSLTQPVAFVIHRA